MLNKDRAMITSSELLKGAGIKTPKTLTRWHQQGIIPKPRIKTHPSGRGKVAYWPDWVLGKCKRIRQLQKAGYSLKMASEEADRERLLQDVEFFQKMQPGAKPGLEFPGGLQLSPDALLAIFILDDIRKYSNDEDFIHHLSSRLKLAPLCRECDDILARKGVPVLVTDGKDLAIVPDFSLNHLLRLKASSGRCLVVLPLLHAIRNSDSVLGRTPTPDPDTQFIHEPSTTISNAEDPGTAAEMKLSELIDRINATMRSGREEQ
jgi:hypothetical protein